MKPIRLAFALSLLVAGACSSPTEPRLPQPNPDDDEEPNQPGMSASAAPAVPAGLTFVLTA